MKIETFLMERMQSTWENEVECNLTESGAHPLRLDELPGEPALDDVLLGYGHTAGTAELRARIGALYGLGPDEVLVTNGTAEANFLAAWHFAEPGADVVMMVPNYMQIWGAGEAFGARLLPFPLRESGDSWRPDLDELSDIVGDRTRLIAVCNPNNPTGAVLSRAEMEEICRLADEVGAWVLADEVYRGAELEEGEETPSFQGLGERVLVTAGLSKAYGLPGLRIGWLAGPASMVAELWRYKDYTTIGPGALSDRIARHVLEPDIRGSILGRSRRRLAERYAFIADWLRTRKDLFGFRPPRAGAFVYPRYRTPVGSTRLCELLRTEHGVLIVPGDHFGMDGYLRIGFGVERRQLERGLAALEGVLSVFAAASPPQS